MVRKLVNQFASADAVDLGHLNVHQNHVHADVLRQLNGLFTAVAQQGGFDQFLEQRPDKLEIGRVVVDGHHRHRQALAAMTCAFAVLAAVFEQIRHQSHARHRLTHAGIYAFTFELFGRNLELAWQCQYQAIAVA